MFSQEELIELKEVVDGITTHIPEHRMGYIWNNYNKIMGGKAGAQPCACGSAAKYWRAAVDELRAYVNTNE